MPKPKSPVFVISLIFAFIIISLSALALGGVIKFPM